MESAQYEKPQASFVVFGEGDMGRYVVTSGGATNEMPQTPGTGSRHGFG